MSMACSTHEGETEFIQVSVGEPEGKKPLRSQISVVE